MSMAYCWASNIHVTKQMIKYLCGTFLIRRLSDGSGSSCNGEDERRRVTQLLEGTDAHQVRREVRVHSKTGFDES